MRWLQKATFLSARFWFGGLVAVADWWWWIGSRAKKGFEIAHTPDLRSHWAFRIFVIYDDHEEKDEKENPF